MDGFDYFCGEAKDLKWFSPTKLHLQKKCNRILWRNTNTGPNIFGYRQVPINTWSIFN